MRKKIFGIAIAVMLTAGLVTGCGGKAKETKEEAGSKTTSESATEKAAEKTTEKTQQKEKGEVIRVATMPNHIGLPLQYAVENGMYEEAGLNVELILFPTGAPINEALAAEQVDIAGSGMAAVFALASGDCYWLGDIVETIDGIGVYVRPDSPILKDKGLVEGYPNVYGSKDTIKNLTILGALGTSDQFVATAWAQVFGLSGNDYQMLNMERGPAIQAFKTGEGDAIACGGPPHNHELEAAGFIEAADLKDVSGFTVTDGLVGRKSFVDKRSDDIKKFLEVSYKAIDEFCKSDELRLSYGMEFYNANGKNYTEEKMQGEIRDKEYIGTEKITSSDYRFGSTMVSMGRFYIQDGKIEPELEENIYTAQYPDLLDEVLGADIKVFENQ